MTVAEALAGIASVMGGGGVVAIVVAWLGYRAEALKGRRTVGAEVARLRDGQEASHMTSATAHLAALVAELIPALKAIGDHLERLAKSSEETAHQLTEIRRNAERD